VQCKKKAMSGSDFCSIHSGTKKKPVKKSPVKTIKKSSVKTSIKSPKKICDEAVEVLGEDRVKEILTKAMNKAKTSPAKLSTGEIMVKLVLKPYVFKENSSGEIIQKGYGDKNWNKALQIVKNSLSLLEKFVTKIERTLIPIARGRGGMAPAFEVVLFGPRKGMIAAIGGKTDNPEAEINQIEAYIKDNYGASAEDTWMEGDINIYDNYELKLILEDIKTVRFK